MRYFITYADDNVKIGIYAQNIYASFNDFDTWEDLLAFSPSVIKEHAEVRAVKAKQYKAHWNGTFGIISEHDAKRLFIQAHLKT